MTLKSGYIPEYGRHSTSTFFTIALSGPERIASIKTSMLSLSPAATTSTALEIFLTNPLIPTISAFLFVKQRNDTSWTLPLTLIFAAYNVIINHIFLGLKEIHR